MLSYKPVGCQWLYVIWGHSGSAWMKMNLCDFCLLWKFSWMKMMAVIAGIKSPVLSLCSKLKAASAWSSSVVQICCLWHSLCSAVLFFLFDCFRLNLRMMWNLGKILASVRGMAGRWWAAFPSARWATWYFWSALNVIFLDGFFLCTQG